MPILSPQDPLIKRLGLTEVNAWGSALPNYAEAAQTFSGPAKNAVAGQFARAQIATWADDYQKLSGSVMQGFGAPQGDAIFGGDLFNGLMGILKVESPASDLLAHIGHVALDKFVDVAVGIIEEILLPLITDLLDPLISGVGSIPVAGWILEAVWDVAVGIVKLVRLIKEQNAPEPDPEYEIAHFSPDADKALAAEIGQILRFEANWTNIYMPPGIGRNATWGGNFFGENLVNDSGYRIRSAGEKEGWLGCIPGTTQIDHGFELFTVGGDRGLGDLFPTARNLQVSVWDQLNRDSPTMYSVDAIRCRNYWEGHLRELREHLYETDIPNAKRFVDDLGRRLFSWSSWDHGKAVYDKWQEGRYDGDGDLYAKDMGVSHLSPAVIDSNGNPRFTPAKAMQTLYQRQMAFLNSTSCAYVNKANFGAFQGNTFLQPETQGLIDRYEKNRQILLEHPARCGVDVSNIPDHVYKAKMEEVQQGCLPPHLGQLQTPIPLPGQTTGEAPPPVNQVPGDAVIHFPTTEDVKRHVKNGGKLTPWLLVAAALGGLWYAKKKGKI